MIADATIYDVETLNFRLTRADYLKFNSYHFFSTLHRPRSILTLLSVPLVITSIEVYDGRLESVDPRSALMAAIVFLLAALGWAILLSLQTWLSTELKWRKCLREPLFQHSSRAALSEEGVFYLNPEAQTRWSWSYVKRVVTTKTLILVYVSDAAAMIVPKRAFDGVAHAERFEAFARGHSLVGRRPRSSQA
jgi:hypothetical protein